MKITQQTTGWARRAAGGAALLAVLGLAACETPGKVGSVDKFDWTGASVADIADALDRDGRVAVTGVLFETDSDKLSDDGEGAALLLAGVLRDNPEMKVAIVGHTDSVGEFRYNLDLSERRARAIGSYLTREGIPADRLASVGVGEISPVADNATPEGRAQNRRVEVVLID